MDKEDKMRLWMVNATPPPPPPPPLPPTGRTEDLTFKWPTLGDFTGQLTRGATCLIPFITYGFVHAIQNERALAPVVAGADTGFL